MARMYPGLTISLRLAQLKPILFSYRSIDFAREILKVTNKFNLLYIIEFQKANKQTNKNQTQSQAFSLHWVSMVVGCNHEGLEERKNKNAISLKL